MSTKIPQASRDYENTRIIERPDGFYWYYENTSEKNLAPSSPCLMQFMIWNTRPSQIMSWARPWNRPKIKSACLAGLILQQGSPAKSHFVLKTKRLNNRLSGVASSMFSPPFSQTLKNHQSKHTITTHNSFILSCPARTQSMNYSIFYFSWGLCELP